MTKTKPKTFDDLETPEWDMYVYRINLVTFSDLVLILFFSEAEQLLWDPLPNEVTPEPLWFHEKKSRVN